MSISGVTSASSSYSYTPTRQTLPGSSSGSGASSAAGIGSSSADDETPAQKFMDYMKESPAQRFEDAWLTSHGISKAAFNAMSLQQKQAIMNEMKQDYERKMKDAAEDAVKQSGQSIDIMA